MTRRAVRRRLAFYLRSTWNVHYFANLKPFIDVYLDRGRDDVSVVTRGLHPGWESVPEYDGYRHLFVHDQDIDRYDLVITPTHLRPAERPSYTAAVQVFHGLSDKPFTYARDFSGYDLCLCAGLRQVERLRLNPANAEARCVIIGYPKFDGVRPVETQSGRSRPRAIYCPTWKKGGLSSVDRFLDDLETVRQMAEIFDIWIKPHPNLLNPERPYYDSELIERLVEVAELRGVELIRAGNVMPWMASADLFVGDISATGYEWLYFDKPMVFLNPRPGALATSRSPNSRTFLWQCGHVCDDPGALPATMAAALENDQYGSVREKILNYSVYRPREGGAADRGAEAIDSLLDDRVERAG